MARPFRYFDIGALAVNDSAIIDLDYERAILGLSYHRAKKRIRDCVKNWRYYEAHRRALRFSTRTEGCNFIVTRVR